MLLGSGGTFLIAEYCGLGVGPFELRGLREEGPERVLEHARHGRRLPAVGATAIGAAVLVVEQLGVDLGLAPPELEDAGVHGAAGDELVDLDGLGLADAVTAVLGLAVVHRVEVQVMHDHLAKTRAERERNESQGKGGGKGY